MSYKLFRVRLQQFFRRTGLLRFVESLRYYQKRIAYQKSNKLFFKGNPDFILPPDHLAFDAYNAPKWKFYKESGETTARFIKEIAARYSEKIMSVYEWGCGPARVIRHLAVQFSYPVEIFGSDYNEETIEWCKKNIPGVQFTLNGLNPPLQYADNKFDLTYCISVFTHLSAGTGAKWAEELFRVLKPGGILMITTLGDHSYNTELLPGEKKKYEHEGIVVRDQYTEGKKMYLTIHNPDYVKQTLLKKFEILEHIPSGSPYMTQDCWIARKK